MPLAHVGYNPKPGDPLRQIIVGDEARTFPGVRDILPPLIAATLTGTEPGSSLDQSDIEVHVKPFGPDDITGDYGITIIIDANQFPSRMATLPDRTDGIQQDVCEHIAKAHQALNGGDGRVPTWAKPFVWVRLMPASFKDDIPEHLQ